MSSTLMKAVTASGILAAGIAILAFAAAMAVQNGIFAAATGGVGNTTSVEYAMWVIGAALTLVGGIALPLALRRPTQATNSV